MALNQEIIKANQSLAGLTDEQIGAIVTLSTNDEQTVIGAKTAEISNQYLESIKTASGIDINQNEEGISYLSRVIGSYKESAGKAGEYHKMIGDLQGEISSLKQQISEGKGDEAIRQQLKDATSELASIRDQYEADKTAWSGKETKLANDLANFRINSQFDNALLGIKYKAGLPDSVVTTMVDSAKAFINGQYKVDFVNAGGKEVMVFRDDKGEIVRNAANALQPYTAAELLTERLKDIIDTGKHTQGAGGGKEGGANPDILDISGARSQVEADEIIGQYLMKKGLTRDSMEYHTEFAKIRQANEVHKLRLS